MRTLFLLLLSGFAAVAVWTLPIHPAAAGIRLAAADIIVIPVWAPLRREPWVGHEFEPPFVEAVDAWARVTIAGDGSPNRLRVIIREASVQQTPLATGARLFTREPEFRYDATVTVELDLRDNYDVFQGSVSATVTRSQEVLEDTPPEELQEIRAAMVLAMLADLEAELANQINTHLSTWLR